MSDTWTTRRLLTWTTDHLEQRGIDSPRVASEMLLSHVLGMPRLRLYMEPDRPADDAERATFRDLVQRAAKHEPVDYLVGKTPFFSMELTVSPAVLIPRPSTETLVEEALQHARQRQAIPLQWDEAPPQNNQAPDPASPDTPPQPTPPDPVPPAPLRIADICTGSGAIAIAIARQLPHATVLATDLSTDALAIAQQNAQDHGVADRITFAQGDLYEPLGDERFDYLLSNPPYISDAEWADVAPNVKDYEPTLALRSGSDGLDHLRPLIAAAKQHLKPDGLLLLEMAASHSKPILDLAAAAGLQHPTILKDHENLPRILRAQP